MSTITSMPSYNSGTYSGRNGRERRLELVTKKPDLALFQAELDQALSDANWYYRRNQHAYDWWHSRWDGQTIDGRKHRTTDEEDPFPWEGASDTRPRTVDRVVRQHITFAKFVFRGAKIQAKAIRPFGPMGGLSQTGGSAARDGGSYNGGGTQGEQSERVTQLLQWMIYTHMASELRREWPLGQAWKFGYGAAVYGIQWEQARRLEYHEISLPLIDELIQSGGGDPAMLKLMEGILDPKQEDQFAVLVQQLSPILSQAGARKIVRDLRELRTAQIPVPYVFKSKPTWRALRPCVDILFPSEASDLQEERWVSQREWVNESTLKDRIETEGYDERFVKEALKHKGESGNETWLQRTQMERSYYTGAYRSSPAMTSYRDLMELHHFHFKSVEHGVPCIYKTVFSSQVMRTSGGDALYAKHELFDYQHGLFPYLPVRFDTVDRPILSSQGIPEKAYTWEQEIKAQRDGRTDRTSLVNRPALIVPWSKRNVIKNTPLPGAVVGVTRPQELQWMPPPPLDPTPEAIERQVNEQVREFFPLFGVELDPDLKKAYREEQGGELLGEFEELLAQTHALMQQYLPDDVVTRVVGELARPFHVDREEIQGAFEITATIDVHMIDADYAEAKLDMIGKAMAFNTQGNADMSGIFRAAMEIIDPDLAAGVVINSQQATNREIAEEKLAFAQIMAGDEPALPMQANYQLRMQTLQNILRANPRMPARMQMNPDSQDILQNRMQFFQRQLQQQQNAQIGRMQTTQTFSKQAPQATMPGQGPGALAALPAG